jgi:hypothetical protein
MNGESVRKVAFAELTKEVIRTEAQQSHSASRVMYKAVLDAKGLSACIPIHPDEYWQHAIKAEADFSNGRIDHLEAQQWRATILNGSEHNRS